MLLTMLSLANSWVLAQNKASNPWAFITENNISGKSEQRQIVPQAYKTLQLEVVKMQLLLLEAPLWHTQAAEDKAVILTLPMPDGTFQNFRIVEAPVMHPDLAAKYPMIKTYAGMGIDDPSAYLRFDMTQRGFHAMVRTPGSSTVFIDPYSTADIEYYVSYYKKDFQKNEPFECLFEEVNKNALKEPLPQFEKAGDCQFRTYVLALACTGEYASFHGGTVPLALAAMTTTMARVNGVFETDASVHMELHPNTDTLIFLNANTDPYTNNNGSTMLGQNQTTCDSRIGNANYDIGHVFSTGGGGVAYLKSLCNSSNKAGGVTGSSNPVGDPFDIDYVAHEMGHQYGGNHTFNSSAGSCSGNQNNSTAMEPGSATTIMGYAGICAPENVQNNSDDYFHAISLQEIGIEVTGTGSGGGNTCSSNMTFNNAPSASAGADFTIPKSTPFVLTGTGSDPNGDPLTYTWEQMDNQTATMPPVSTNTGGPAFRSFKGTSSPDRYLPRLQDIVNNVSPTWEVLASVGRTYNWRLTVRDNHIGGGCTAEDNMVVTVSNASGPFLVTAPNTAVSWPALSTQNVAWDVANTTAAPVSCTNVDILLSLDGGFTYPVVLAMAVPNDGSQDVVVPDNQTALARVMVRGNGNIFFDISNTNFTIGPPLNDYTLSVSPDTLAVCSPANAVFDVAVGVTGTFSGIVTLTASGEPAGTTLSFSVNPVNVPGSSQLTIGNMAAATPGTYDITITGSGSTGQKSETVKLVITNGLPTAVNLLFPVNGAIGIPQITELAWDAQPGTAAYTLQIADDPAFTNLLADTSGIQLNYYSPVAPFDINTTYYWRVKAVNACGEGAFSTVFSFTTVNIVCSTFASTDVPKSISSSGTPTVTSTLVISADGTITDVNVMNLDIDHTYIDDLVVKLKSPANTERTLLNQICGSQNNILLNLDDESTNGYSSIPCPPNGGTYQPYQTLSSFDGQNLNGTWTLTINDLANQDGGTLQAWSLAVCYTPSCTPPVIDALVVTQPNCATPAGTVVIDASGSGPLDYSVNNGITWQTSATFSGLPPSDYSIKVRMQSDTTCSSVYASNPVTILAAPALPVVDSVTLTQPTCTTPDATILIHATGSSALEYSINNGLVWQASETFPGLSSGDYDIVVRLQSDTTCSVTFGSNPVSILPVSALPVVDAPALSQPTCSVPTGMIEVNATGSGTLEYSIDNGMAWQISDTFSGLPPGDYAIVVRIQSDTTCSVAYGSNPVAIMTPPVLPVVNAPTVTAPTCAEPTGTIVVNATGSGLLEYSIDNGINYQQSDTFALLAVGTFDIVVRLVADPACQTAYSDNPMILDAPVNCCIATLEVNEVPIPNGTYEVEISISSNGAVPDLGDVLFKAGTSVELLPGFEVSPGGVFEIIMEGCVPTGNMEGESGKGQDE